MSTFNAEQLHWPPLKALYEALESIKLDPATCDVAAFKSTLVEYTPWLAKGLAGFCTPNEGSKKAIAGEATRLSLGGGKEETVQAALRDPVLSVSKALDLDEVQAYILLTRWQANGPASPTAAVDTAIQGGRGLTPDQLRAVTLFYSQERLLLLQSIEDLLWLGEEDVNGAGPFATAVEEVLGSLLGGSDGLEEVTAQALKSNLQGGSSGGAGPFVVGGAAAKAAEGRSFAAEETVALERNVLLTILALIYFHPRKQCTPQRFLELARVFNVRLFSAPPPSEADNSAAASIAHLSIKLAAMLLLEVLALDVKTLEAVAEGGDLGVSASAFFDPSTQPQVDAELRLWRAAPGAPHAGVLLAWASLLTLGGRPQATEHAERAHQAHALAALRNLASPTGLRPAIAEVAATIVASATATVLAAFGLDPATIAPQQVDLVVGTLCDVFSLQPRLCDAFWMDPCCPAHAPILHFLDGLAALYPAFPLPLLRLLTALAAGTRTAAASAYAYLCRRPTLTWLHELPNPGIDPQGEDPEAVVSTAELELPGAPGLTLFAGVAGQILPLDSAAWGAWGRSGHAVHVVQWQLPLEEEAGQWALLCRAFGALHAMQGSNGGDSAAALAECEATVALLATLCCSDPAGTAVEVIRAKVHFSSSNGAGLHSGADALDLACQLLSTLLLAPHGMHAMGTVAHCMRVCTSFVPSSPGRVTAALLRALEITPLDVSLAARAPGGPLLDSPALRCLHSVEGEAGRYPGTQELLDLLTALLQAGCPSPALSPLVTYVMQHVMPELPHRKYEDGADRWRLAAACLTVVREALLAAPSDFQRSINSSNDSGVAAAVVAVLSSYSGAAACLLPLLPPDARSLEAMAQNQRLVGRVEAAEKCCGAWLRLVPVLLPPDAADDPSQLLAPGAFLRAQSQTAGDLPPAATLLSFLTYPYFGAKKRALVVRAMHSFAVAAAATAPDVPMVALLPHDGPRVAAGAKAALAEALSPATAQSCDVLFSAACDVIGAAVHRHPSLLDALLFPSPLEASSDKENKSGNAEAAGKPLVKTEAGAAKDPPAGPSCLDALWAIVEQGESLHRSAPFALAKALGVVAALWQSGGPAYRALSALCRQPGFWNAVVRVVEAGAVGGAIKTPMETDGSSPETTQREMEAACWRVAAEAAALQVLTAECSAAMEPMPARLEELMSGGLTAAVPALMKRYCLVLPTATALGDASRMAAAAAAEILAVSLEEDVLRAALEAGPSLPACLAAAAAPDLNYCRSERDATVVLEGLAAAAMGASGEEALRARPVLRALSEGMLSQAEVPTRAAGPFGPRYIFDGALLNKRVGAALAHDARLLEDLSALLSAASLGCSLEEARSDAAAALKSLVTVAEGLRAKRLNKNKEGGVKQSDAASEADVAAAEAVVESIVDAVVATAQRRAAPKQEVAASVIDLHGIHLDAAAAAAQVGLVMLRRRQKLESADAAAAACARTLLLAANWIDARRLLPEGGEDHAVTIASKCLLASCLIAVAALPAGPETVAAAPPSPAAQQVQHAALHLIPSLLALIDETGPASTTSQRGVAVAAAALVSGLAERAVPPEAWLPLLQHHFDFGRALTAAVAAMEQGQGLKLVGSKGESEPAMAAASPLKQPSTLEEAVLLMALQAAQFPAGASMLVQQGLPALLLSLAGQLSRDLLEPEAAPATTDYSRAYSAADGAPATSHRLWCATLALLGLLLAAAPGMPAVEGAALQAAVRMDPRLLLAVEPPEGGAGQPVTLAMAQETRYSLFLLCGVAAAAGGQWRMALPHALPAFRRASAALLRFLAEPADVVCGPVSAAERAAAAAPPPSQSTLSFGWFGASSNPSSSLAWEMAEQLYACAQYALAFQLTTAPELSEAESAALGPEWPEAAVLRTLQSRCIEGVDSILGLGRGAADPAVLRVLRLMVSMLRTAGRLSEVEGLGQGGAEVLRRLEVAAAVERAEAILATHEAVSRRRPWTLS